MKNLIIGAITDAINQAGLQADLQYLGGGSGLGEAGLRAGSQNIAPMSRALSSAAIEDLLNQGATPIAHVIEPTLIGRADLRRSAVQLQHHRCGGVGVAWLPVLPLP